MKEESHVIEEFNQRIDPLAKQLGLSELDINAIAKEAFLYGDAFLRARPPVIVVTGVTHTGKSTLINAIFGEKKLKEGLVGDTTDYIVKIRFKSGLLIYDTPGAGGLKVLFENRTRAFLGLSQLSKDINGLSMEPLTEIETIDAHTYNKVTNTPIQKLSFEQFERPDLFLFIVDIKAGTIRREDIIFFREVASIGAPIIVAVNKIDEVDTNAIHESLSYVMENFSREAIPVSAKKGINIDTLISQIIKNLPKDCMQVLTETVNADYKRLVRQQMVTSYSLATAVRTSQLVGRQGKVEDNKQLVSNVIGLYLWILGNYSISEHRIKRSGLNLTDVSAEVESKIKQLKGLSGNTGLVILASTIVGGIIATVGTGGIALPTILAAAIGAFSGASIGGVIGTINALIRRGRLIDMRVENEKLKEFTNQANPLETAASIFAFGEAIRRCCDTLERDPNENTTNFYDAFQEEYIKAKPLFAPFGQKIRSAKTEDVEQIADEIIAQISSFPIYKNK